MAESTDTRPDTDQEGPNTPDATRPNPTAEDYHSRLAELETRVAQLEEEVADLVALRSSELHKVAEVLRSIDAQLKGQEVGA